jgi:16S rRNA (guanine527-N7)-methyltransferase
MRLETLLQDSKLELTPKQIEALENYSKMLLEWGAIHNLTGSKDETKIYQNILDSIYPVKFVDDPKSLLDVGSGAGFPAIPLAVVWRNAQMVLAEPRNKRASFLRFVAMELGLESVKVEKKRVENLDLEPFELITSRAVNKVEDLIKITAHLSNKDTEFLFYKGENLQNEIKSLREDSYQIVSRGLRNYLYIC